MTGDLKFFQPDFSRGTIGPCDIHMNGAIPERDDGLETALLIAILTDRRAKDDDVLPSSGANKGGHFSDVLTGVNIGSRLWLLKRSRINADTLTKAEEYIKEALADQIIGTGLAASADVTVTAGQGNRINISITLHKPSGVSSRYALIWESMAA